MNRSTRSRQMKESTSTSAQYKCIHTCQCKGASSRETYSWPECRRHVLNRYRHPSCGSACPGFQLLSSALTELDPKQFELEDDRRMTMLGREEEDEKPIIKKRESSSNVDLLRISPPLSRLRPRQYEMPLAEDDEVETHVYKCSHTCPCIGSTSTISAGGCTFTSRMGAQRHVSTHSRHPECTPSCPAYRWNNVTCFGVVEVIETIENKKKGVAKKRRVYEMEDTQSPSPPPLSTKKSRIESGSTASHPNRLPPPPRFGALAKSMHTDLPKQQTQTSLTATHPPDELIPSIPQRSSLSYSHFFVPMIINMDLVGDSLLMQHCGSLVHIYETLAQIHPKFQALSMRLDLLPFITPHTARFIADGGIIAAFLSEIINVSETLEDIDKTLQSLLQVKDPLSLLDIQDTELRDLRRHIMNLNNLLFDLRLDVQRADKTQEGLKGKREKVGEDLHIIIDRFTEAENRVQKLVLMTTNQFNM